MGERRENVGSKEKRGRNTRGQKKEQWYKGEKEWNMQKKKGDRNKSGKKEDRKEIREEGKIQRKIESKRKTERNKIDHEMKQLKVRRRKDKTIYGVRNNVRKWKAEKVKESKVRSGRTRERKIPKGKKGNWSGILKKEKHTNEINSICFGIRNNTMKRETENKKNKKNALWKNKKYESRRMKMQ